MDIAVQRASVVLGFLTLGSVLAVFASCRSCLGLLRRFGLNPMSGKAYQAFFRYHALYWQAFFLLLAAHLSLAFAHTGIPQAGDPDAPVHWRILALGLAAALSGGVLFSSCRISFGFLTRSLKSRKGYPAFNAFHGYYWLILFGLIAMHFYFAHAHVGFWPMPMPMPGM